MTVVPDSGGGTITVVLFCGAGGLLLLMHPDSAVSTTSEASIVFMFNPLTSLDTFNASAACGYRRCIGFVPARYPSSVTSYSGVITGFLRQFSSAVGFRW